MRRFSQGDDWGYTPVLQQQNLFPKALPSRISFQPTSLKRLVEGAGFKVVIGRNKLVSRSKRYGIFKTHETVPLADYLGVAVHYTPAPSRFALKGLMTFSGMRRLIPNRFRLWFTSFLREDAGRFKTALSDKLSFLLKPDVKFSEKTEGAVTLYLLHEDRRKDLLLYYADHEDDIIALWRYWAQRLDLPQLMVAPDGTINEPLPPRNSAEIRKTFPRKEHLLLKRRKPVFLRVRDTGRHCVTPHCYGRGIMARS